MVDALVDLGPNAARHACVVAHSISGVFLPLIGRMARVRQLVYLAAAVPRPGMSFRQQLDATPDMYNPDWIASGRKIVSDEHEAIRFLYHDCSAEITHWALQRRIRFRAAKLWTEPYAAEAHPHLPTRYVVCNLDRTFTPAWMERAARKVLDVAPAHVEAGHCPYLSRPGKLAELLVHKTIV